MNTNPTPTRPHHALLMVVLLLSLTACKTSYIRPADPQKPPVVDCEQPPRDPTLPDPPATNDPLQWSLVLAKLYSIIGIERGDRRLEHECIDRLKKKGDIR